MCILKFLKCITASCCWNKFQMETAGQSGIIFWNNNLGWKIFILRLNNFDKHCGFEVGRKRIPLGHRESALNNYIGLKNFFKGLSLLFASLQAYFSPYSKLKAHRSEQKLKTLCNSVLTPHNNTNFLISTNKPLNSNIWNGHRFKWINQFLFHNNCPLWTRCSSEWVLRE